MYEKQDGVYWNRPNYSEKIHSPFKKILKGKPGTRKKEIQRDWEQRKVCVDYSQQRHNRVRAEQGSWVGGVCGGCHVNCRLSLLQSFRSFVFHLQLRLQILSRFLISDHQKLRHYLPVRAPVMLQTTNKSRAINTRIQASLFSFFQPVNSQVLSDVILEKFILILR